MIRAPGVSAWATRRASPTSACSPTSPARRCCVGAMSPPIRPRGASSRPAPASTPSPLPIRSSSRTRPNSAHASASPDSIKGLAQSVARPAYRRLLTAEPALRRAVPSLIIAFLLSVGIGAILQVYDRHRQALAVTFEDIEAIAAIVADRLNSSVGEGAVATPDGA